MRWVRAGFDVWASVCAVLAARSLSVKRGISDGALRREWIATAVEVHLLGCDLHRRSIHYGDALAQHQLGRRDFSVDAWLATLGDLRHALRLLEVGCVWLPRALRRDYAQRLSELEASAQAVMFARHGAEMDTFVRELDQLLVPALDGMNLTLVRCMGEDMSGPSQI